eukprot:scaffold252_cov338-Pavlova_lutheri.AAC.2
MDRLSNRPLSRPCPVRNDAGWWGVFRLESHPGLFPGGLGLFPGNPVGNKSGPGPNSSWVPTGRISAAGEVSERNTWTTHLETWIWSIRTRAKPNFQGMEIEKKRKDDGAREWWGWSGMVTHSSASRLCEGVPADAHTAQHTWSSMQNEGRRGWCRHAHFLHLPVSDWNGACLHHMVLQWYGKKDGSRIRCMHALMQQGAESGQVHACTPGGSMELKKERSRIQVQACTFPAGAGCGEVQACTSGDGTAGQGGWIENPGAALHLSSRCRMWRGAGLHIWRWHCRPRRMDRESRCRPAPF